MSLSDVMGRIGEIRGTMASMSGYRDDASSGAGADAQSVALRGRIQNTAGANPVAQPGIDPELFTQALGAAQGTGDPLRQLQGLGTSGSTGLQDVLRSAVQAPAPAPVSGISGVQRVASPPASGNGTSGSDVVASARKYLGVPYVWGGNNPKIGLDCSSLVQQSFKDLGVSLPRVARDQAKQGTEVPSLAQAKPGDLIVTRGGGHIGIYLGDNKMIHAPRPGENVSIRKLFETDADIMTIRRIVPADGAAAPAQAVAGADNTLAAQRAAFEGAKA